jgi:hypothetical protein
MQLTTTSTVAIHTFERSYCDELMPKNRLTFDLSAAASKLTTPNERLFKRENPAKHMLMGGSCSPKNRLFFDSSVSASKLVASPQLLFTTEEPAKQILVGKHFGNESSIYYPRSTPTGSIRSELTIAAEALNRLLQNRFGATKYIYTAMEVFYFSKDAKSLHVGEYHKYCCMSLIAN